MSKDVLSAFFHSLGIAFSTVHHPSVAHAQTHVRPPTVIYSQAAPPTITPNRAASFNARTVFGVSAIGTVVDLTPFGSIIAVENVAGKPAFISFVPHLESWPDNKDRWTRIDGGSQVFITRPHPFLAAKTDGDDLAVLKISASVTSLHSP